MEHPSFGRKSQTLGKARTGALGPLQSWLAAQRPKLTCWTLFKTFLQPPLGPGELPPAKPHQHKQELNPGQVPSPAPEPHRSQAPYRAFPITLLTDASSRHQPLSQLLHHSFIPSRTHP